MSIYLRPALESDQAFLRRLHRAAYEALTVRLYGEWNDGREEERFAAKVQRAAYQVIERGGQRVGAVSRSELDDHIRLYDLMILPAQQRCGIGSQVLLAEVERAAGKPLRLHTSVMNDGAQRFYRRQGFVEVGRDEEFVDFERAG